MSWPPEGQRIDADGHIIVGETLRDRIAISAMSALISSEISMSAASSGKAPLKDQIAAWSYEFADAMLKQRDISVGEENE